jgi:sulfur dioxygenase
MEPKTIFYQLFECESSTYTYLIADPITKEAALIDTVLETVERDLKLVEELDLKLKYVLDTHVHADHVTGAGEARTRTGAKSAVSAGANVECVDISLNDGQELFLGNKKIKALATPGHTDSCMSYVFEGRVFTGDALLVRGTGRTDFQQGSSEKLFESVHEKLFTLPEDTLVYPAHDYRGQTASTIGLEMKLNPRLGAGKSKAEFVKTMSELKLANPKKIHEAVHANLACGRVKDLRTLVPAVNNGVPEIPAEKVRESLGRIIIIDVRGPEEFNGELGHIQGAQCVPLGPDLTRYLEKGDPTAEIVFVCGGGGRSGRATLESQKLGYRYTSSLAGGMRGWNQSLFPVEKN